MYFKLWLVECISTSCSLDDFISGVVLSEDFELWLTAELVGTRLETLYVVADVTVTLRSSAEGELGLIVVVNSAREKLSLCVLT